MPLKSATCGRELEAGLRRRPGSNNVTFDGKPLDGVFFRYAQGNATRDFGPVQLEMVKAFAKIEG
jgi:hypothetical protein